MPVNQPIKNQIKEQRKKRGITQEELGKAMDVSRQTIISIERGHYVPSLPLALKLARYFRCGTDEIFQLED